MHSFLEPKLLWFQGPGKKVIGRKRQDSGFTLRMNSFYFSHCCLRIALQAELGRTVSLTLDLSSSGILCPRGLLLIFWRPYLMPAIFWSHMPYVGQGLCWRQEPQTLWSSTRRTCLSKWIWIPQGKQPSEYWDCFPRQKEARVAKSPAIWLCPESKMADEWCDL